MSPDLTLRKTRRPAHVLVLDTETTVDASQRFTFGSARYFRVDWRAGVPDMRCVIEYLIHADDLAATDPRGMAKLLRHAECRDAATDLEVPEADPDFVVWPREVFVRRILLRLRQFDAALVGFNLPFDLSRLALGWTVAENRRASDTDPFNRGFSLTLRKSQAVGDNTWQGAAIDVKTIDGKRHLMRFTNAADPFGRGHFLDLHALAFALSDKSLSLDAACQAFGVADGKVEAKRHGLITHRYIDYNRTDVAATGRLFEKLMIEHLRHPIDQAAPHSLSAAIGKGYLRKMGITRPLLREGRKPCDLSWDQIHGASMTAYYGGRAECRIRRTDVPVSVVDFTSAYPTVAVLTRTWDFLRAERIDATDEPPEATQAWIDGLTLEDCFRQETWESLSALVLVAPDGDALPIRARYQGSKKPWGIGVNRLWSAEPLWYPLADAVASKLLTGKAPNIIRTIRFAPVGRIDGLKRVTLQGTVRINPNDPKGDLFRTIIEQRHRVPVGAGLSDEERERLDRFPKTLANATAYGILAEMVRRDLIGEATRDLKVFGLWDRTLKVPHPEDPGEFSFPPMAATTTAGARLLLAMLEKVVVGAEGKDGAYAFCDTDSMAIVAAERGRFVPCSGGPHRARGLPAVRAMAWDEVDALRARFNDLNPYDRKAVPDLLKLTEENFADPDKRTGRREVRCFAVSAKRYALFVPGRAHGVVVVGSVELRATDMEGLDDALDVADAKEHGLAQFLNPFAPESRDRDWITEAWRYLIYEDLAFPGEAPSWLDRPAVSRLTCSSPDLMASFGGFNGDKKYEQAVKPFNFMLVAYPQGRAGLPHDADPARFVLVAPYERDSRQWERMHWYNRHDPEHTKYRITTLGETGGHGLVRVKTYRDVLADYLAHAESKSADADGKPCSGMTTGLLRRRGVATRRGLIRHVGKESNDLERRIHQLTADESDYLNSYDSDLESFRDLVIPVLQDFRSLQGPEAVVAAAVVPWPTIRDILSGRTREPSRAYCPR